MVKTIKPEFVINNKTVKINYIPEMLNSSVAHYNNGLNHAFYLSTAILAEPLTHVTVIHHNHGIVSQSYPIKRNNIVSVSQLNCTEDLYNFNYNVMSRSSCEGKCTKQNGIWDSISNTCVQTFYINRICYFIEENAGSWGVVNTS